jgi:hypothetical protein
MSLDRDLHLTRHLGDQVVQVNVRGMLSGADLFILCAGPSLLDTDLDLLRRPGVLIMGVNNAFGVLRNGQCLRGHLWVGADQPNRFLPSVLADPTIVKFARLDYAENLVTDLGRPFRACPNLLFWKAISGHEPRPSVLDIDETGDLPWKHSSFFAALLIALRLGVKNIYLVGVDFQGDRGNFYGFDESRTEREWELNRILFDSLVAPLEFLHEQARSVDSFIFNTVPGSRLRVFPYRSLAQCVENASSHIGIPALEQTRSRYSR